MEKSHEFRLSVKEAVAEQRRLASYVEERELPTPPRTVAGYDLSIRGGHARAAAVVVDIESMDTVDEAVVETEITFPYIPGLLSFREAPAVIAAHNALLVPPDLLMLDGQGRAHPRRFGIACHVGLIVGLPAMGIAKSLLVGKGTEPGNERGDTAPIVHRSENVGVALRTRTGVTPVYVSIGHLITLEEAADLALRLAPRLRIPEPTRRAHILAGKW